MTRMFANSGRGRNEVNDISEDVDFEPWPGKGGMAGPQVRPTRDYDLAGGVSRGCLRLARSLMGRAAALP